LVTFVSLLLETHFPPLLLPLLTFAIGGLIVALRSHSEGVVSSGALWAIVGWVGLVTLYLIPFVEPFFLPSGPSIIVLMATLFKQTITELVGDNLISVIWLEVGAVSTLISSTGTDQKWVKALAKWLWRLFAALFVLTVVIRMYELLTRPSLILIK